MSLFDFKGNKVEVSRDIALIAVFRTILERKDSEAILSYIYHYCDWESPYQNIPEDERKQVLIKDFFDGKDSILKDKDVIAAIEKYIELTETPSLKVLNSAKKAVHSLQEYFENCNPADSDDPGKEAKNLMSNLKSVGDIIQKMKDWEELIKQEKDQSTIRKGVELNVFNE